MTPLYQVLFGLMVMGFAVSSGPCLVTCGPLLSSYIAAQSHSIKDGIKLYLVFSLIRLFSYAVLGALLGALGRLFLENIYAHHLFRYVVILFGILIAAIGIGIIVNKFSHSHICTRIGTMATKSNTRNMIIFGLGIGFSPCPPLLGALSYILIISDTVGKGVLYAVSFGIGTILSPLLLCAFFASTFTVLCRRYPRVLSGIRIVGGIVLMLFGFQVIWGAL